MALPRPSAMPSAALALALALVLACAPVPAHANWLPNPDPTCKNGLFAGGVCCPRNCGICGGKGCGERGRRIKSVCCMSAIRKLPRDCSSKGAPCKNVRRGGGGGGGGGGGAPDPQCKRGLYRWRACCPKSCGTCGGTGCWARGSSKGTMCCTGPIRSMPSCATRGPPCSFVGLPLPGSGGGANKPTTPNNPGRPQVAPPSANTGGGGTASSTNGYWRTAPVSSGKLVRRHEACALMHGGLVYLIGGRGFSKPVSVYNPKTKTWTNRKGLQGVELHHMQCVVINGKLYIPTSWTGKYPKEQANKNAYIYDLVNDKWTILPGMPANRRRGGAAVVRRGNILYVVGGNQGGHGDHATSLGYMDAFDWTKLKWLTNIKYPNLPVPRDHTGGGMVNGRLCVAGGRDGGKNSFFFQNKAESFCFNFNSFKWEQVANLPVPRGGANTGTVCSGGLMVAGGEGNGRAYNLVHVFNGSKWVRGPNLREARHGSGVAQSQCGCGHIFIPSGSGAQGGSPELFTTEEFIPNGKPVNCPSY